MDNQIELPIDAQYRAPRVTPADIEAEIVSAHYFTAHDGVWGSKATGAHGNSPCVDALGLLTFCVLVLRNGFTVTGESACVSPENYNADLGRKIARQKAEEKLWPLLGFRLRDKLCERDTVRYRCAETGEYVTQGYAEANPATTVKETD